MDLLEHSLIDDDLIEKAKVVGVEAMKLPARVYNTLLERGVQNSYQAIIQIESGLLNEKGFGEKSKTECYAAVKSFLTVINQTEESTLKTLGKRQQIYFVGCSENIAEILPRIIDLYLMKTSKSYQRDLDILEKRFALNDGREYSLEDIGTYYGVTRERIRQIEAKTLRNLHSLLLGTFNKKWSIDSSITDRFKKLEEELKKHGSLLQKDEIRIVVEMFGSHISDGYLNLLMEIYGYTRLPNKIIKFRGLIKTSWYDNKLYRTKHFESIFQSIDKIFDTPSSVPVFDLVVYAKKQIDKQVDNKLLMSALSCIVELEQENDCIRVKFEHLKNLADKVFRILMEKNAPTHYSTIMAEINVLSKNAEHYKPLTNKGFTNQLVVDERFVPVGRSGEWGLKSWENVNNLTILETIKQVLHKAGQPQNFNQIKQQVLRIRPDASENSIRAYLCDTSNFDRVGIGVYAITSWNLKSIQKLNTKRVGNDILFPIIRELLASQNPTPFPKMILHVQSKTNLAEVSVRQRILSIKALEVREIQGQKYKEVYCKDLNQLNANTVEKKQFLRDKIQQKIRTYLDQHPDLPIKKGNLFRIISKEISCTKPIYYHALSKMSDVTQYKSGNDFYVLKEKTTIDE